NHIRVEIARFLNKLGGGAIGGDHDDGLYGAAPSFELHDGVVDINRITQVVEPQNRAVATSTQRTDRFLDAGETGITVGILLRKDGDLIWRQAPHLDEIVYDGRRLFSVAGAIIEDIAVVRISPQQAGAGKGAEEQHPALERVG